MTMPFQHYFGKKLKTVSKYDILLIILFSFWLANEIYWLHSDNYPLFWDEAHHFTVSLKFYDSIKMLDFQQLLLTDRYYPPLAPLMSIIGYALLGRSPDVGIFFENTPFLILLVFSIYSIGKWLKDESTGLLAAFMVVTSPMVFGLSRTFMLDVPLLAMVTTAIWVMLKTDRFRNRKYSAVYGIVFGFGLLTKWTFLVFSIPPLVVYSFPIAKNWFFHLINLLKIPKFTLNFGRKVSLKNGIIFNCLLAIIFTAIIAAPYYLTNYEIIIQYATTYANVGSNPIPITNPNSWVYYLVSLISIQISFPYFVFFAIGLTYFIKTSHLKREIKILFASWIAIPYILFTLMNNKDPRYTLPIVSAITLTASFGLSEFLTRFKRAKFLKMVTFILVTSIGLTIFFGASYRIVELPTISLPSSAGNITFFGDYSSNIPAYSKKAINEDLKSKEILETISRYEQNSREAIIRMLMENPVVSGPLEYNIVLGDFDYTLVRAEGTGSEDVSYLFDTDIIISQEGGFIGPDWLENEIRNKISFFNEYNNKTNTFELLNSIILPSGWGTVQIYGNKDRHQMILNQTPDVAKTEVIFGEKIELLGFNATLIKVNSRKLLTVSYYWECWQQMSKDYTVFVHFTDENGDIVFSEEHKPVYNLIQTSEWKQGQMFKESYVVAIPENIPGGIYYVRMGIWDTSTKERLKILPISYDDGSNRAIIGKIAISP